MPAGGEVQPLVVEVEVTPAKMKNSVQMLSVCIVISIENGFLWVTKVDYYSLASSPLLMIVQISVRV